MANLNIKTFRHIINKKHKGPFRYFTRCNICDGLDVVRKYLPNQGILTVDSNVLYSVNINDLVAAGITKKDVKRLWELEWYAKEEFLVCRV